MALSAKAQQKKRDKKKRARKKAVKKQVSIVDLSHQWRLHECLLYEGLFENGKGHVIIAKVNQVGDLKVSFFLLDVFCVGIKDVFTRSLDIQEYDGKLREISHKIGNHHQVEPSYACTLIQKTHEFSASLGITKPGIKEEVRKILRGIPTDKTLSFAFGHDGRPMYVPGPDDSQGVVNKILKALDKSVGSGNYTVVENPERMQNTSGAILPWVENEPEVHMSQDRQNKYNQISRTRNSLLVKCLEMTEKFYDNKRFKRCLKSAWKEYFTDLDDDMPEFNMESPEVQMSFLGWFCFNWSFKGEQLPGVTKLPWRTPARYLLSNDEALTKYETDLINAELHSHFSLYQIEHVSGNEITLTDLLTDEEFVVTDILASKDSQLGFILLARIVEFDGFAAFSSVRPAVLPPINKLTVIDLKQWLLEKFNCKTIDHARLGALGYQIRDAFLSMYSGLMNGKPKFINHDGDAILFYEIQYSLNSTPRKIIKQLSKLEGSFDMDGLDKKGVGKIVWIKNASETVEEIVFAELDLDNTLMRVTVNSKERRITAQQEIANALEGLVTLIKVEEQEPENLIEESLDKKAPAQLDPDTVHEISIKLSDKWLTEPVPALGGITPLEAAKHEQGRAKLEVLLEDFDDKSERLKGSMVCFNLDYLRLKLGMEKAS